jgi:hypothetical protein
MPNPSIVAGTVNNGSFTNNTTCTVTSGGSVTIGNMGVIALTLGDLSTLSSGLTPPAGWSNLPGTGDIDIGTNLKVAALFWGPITSGGIYSGSPTWTGTALKGEWTFFEITGQATSPFDGPVLTTQNPSSSTPPSPSATPSSGNLSDLLVCLLLDGAPAAGTNSVTIPAGMTNINTVNGTTSTYFTGDAYLALSSASPTGNQFWTLQVAQPSLGVSFLIQPPVAYVPIFAGDTVIYAEPGEIYPVGISPVGAGSYALPGTFSQLTIAWDISNHLAGNTSSASISADLSLDGGNTWNTLGCDPFPVIVARNQGYNAVPGDPTPTWCYLTVPLPQVGNPNRMVRCWITVSGASILTGGWIEGQ